METSTILVILLSILEVSLVFTCRKKKFNFGEFLSCQIPAFLQVSFLEYIFFEDFPVSPWLFLAITGGSLLLFVIFADKEYKPKTTPGWMWFVAVSLMVTSLGALLLWVFFGKPLDIPNSNNDDVWVPPNE